MKALIAILLFVSVAPVPALATAASGKWPHHRKHTQPVLHVTPKPKPMSLNAAALRYQGNRYSSMRYRVGEYRKPFGWFYHQWAYGDRLPPNFITSEYWIPNYTRFGLMDPPPGFVWVRVDSSAMLVDMDSGEILRAVYQVFY